MNLTFAMPERCAIMGVFFSCLKNENFYIFNFLLAASHLCQPPALQKKMSSTVTLGDLTHEIARHTSKCVKSRGNKYCISDGVCKFLDAVTYMQATVARGKRIADKYFSGEQVNGEVVIIFAQLRLCLYNIKMVNAEYMEFGMALEKAKTSSDQSEEIEICRTRFDPLQSYIDEQNAKMDVLRVQFRSIDLEILIL